MNSSNLDALFLHHFFLIGISNFTDDNILSYLYNFEKQSGGICQSQLFNFSCCIMNISFLVHTFVFAYQVQCNQLLFVVLEDTNRFYTSIIYFFFWFRCNYCENISVYSCYSCNTFLCIDCPKVHNEKNNYQRHALKSLSEGFRLNDTSIVEDDSIKDILCLHSGEVVAAFNKTVVTFSVSGQQINVIELEKGPWRMDVIDTNTVAVLLNNNSVAIVDFQQTRVKYIRDIEIKCTKGSFLYTENQFYVGDGLGITVIDMSGNTKRWIPLSFIPYNMCYNVDSQRIYCISRDTNKLICIDRYGKIEFKFDNSIWAIPQSLTIDNEGNILQLYMNGDDHTGYVIEIAANGKSKGAFMKKLQFPMIDQNCFICFHSLTNSVVIGVDKTVYIYEMESNVLIHDL